jgi:hypothetical protein
VLAEDNPEYHVIGTDLSKIQPNTRSLTNCEFIKEDSEKEWVYPGIKFDYVHFRLTFSCFDDPQAVMKQAFDHLNPGGWIEYQETLMRVDSIEGTVEGWSPETGCQKCSNPDDTRNEYAEILPSLQSGHFGR